MFTEKQLEYIRSFVFDKAMIKFGLYKWPRFISEGFPNWKGVDNMSDEELIVEAGYDPKTELALFLVKLNNGNLER